MKRSAEGARGLRFSIPTRMFLGLAVVIVGFGTLSVVSVLRHQSTGRTLRLLNEGYLPLALTCSELKATQLLVNVELGGVMNDGEAAQTAYLLDRTRRARHDLWQRTSNGIGTAENLAPDQDDRALLRDLRRDLAAVGDAIEAVDPQYEQLFDALAEGSAVAAEESFLALSTDERRIDRLLRQVLDNLQSRIAKMSADAAEQERSAAIVLAVLTLLALAVGLLVVWLSYRMLAPLPRLQRRVEAVGRGDLAPAEQAHSQNELGRLAAAFEEMVAALSVRDQRLREAAEAELLLQQMQELIVANLSAALLVVDGAGEVQTANPAAERMFGLAGGEPGSSAKLDLEQLTELPSALARLSHGEELVAFSAKLTAEAGVRSVNVTVTPVFAAGDNHKRTAAETGEAEESVLVVAEDVTEELQTKERLIHSERLAAIGRMAAHVTHEVRNPLSSIGLNAEMLADELAGNSEAVALLAAIQRELDRLTGITEEYLRLARLPTPELEATQIEEAVDSTFALSFTRVRTRGD